jgi:hypothetical protein
MKTFVLILGVCGLLMAAGCSSGDGDNLDPDTFVAEYYLVGEQPLNFDGPDAESADLQRLVDQLADGRAYFFNLIARGPILTDDSVSFHSTVSDSVLIDPLDIPPGFNDFSATGTAIVGGDTVRVDYDIETAGTGLSDYSDLHLTGTFDRSDAQLMLNDARSPAADTASFETTPGFFTLTGRDAFGDFSLSFTQDLRFYSEVGPGVVRPN